MKKTGFLPRPLMRRIYESVPVPTVDYIVVRRRGRKREFLLGRRANKPYQGKWFIFGGRVWRGEPLEGTLMRLMRQELGIRPTRATPLMCQTYFNPPNDMGVRVHTIYHVYVVIPTRTEIRLSRENRQVKWFSRINPRWPKPVRTALEKARFHA